MLFIRFVLIYSELMFWYTWNWNGLTTELAACSEVKDFFYNVRWYPESEYKNKGCRRTSFSPANVECGAPSPNKQFWPLCTINGVRSKVIPRTHPTNDCEQNLQISQNDGHCSFAQIGTNDECISLITVAAAAGRIMAEGHLFATLI